MAPVPGEGSVNLCLRVHVLVSFESCIRTLTSWGTDDTLTVSHSHTLGVICFWTFHKDRHCYGFICVFLMQVSRQWSKSTVSTFLWTRKICKAISLHDCMYLHRCVQTKAHARMAACMHIHACTHLHDVYRRLPAYWFVCLRAGTLHKLHNSLVTVNHKQTWGSNNGRCNSNIYVS